MLGIYLGVISCLVTVAFLWTNSSHFTHEMVASHYPCTIASKADWFGSPLCVNSCFQPDSHGGGFYSQSHRSCMICEWILIVLPSCIPMNTWPQNFNDLSGRQPPPKKKTPPKAPGIHWHNLGYMLLLESLPELWAMEQLYIIDLCCIMAC